MLIVHSTVLGCWAPSDVSRTFNSPSRFAGGTHDGIYAARSGQGVDWGRVFHPGREAMMQTPIILRHIVTCLCRVASRYQQLFPGSTPRVRPAKHPDRDMPRYVNEGEMLVETDVTKGVRGILP